MKKCFITLGAFGDQINSLPLLLKDSSDGYDVSLCVAKAYESILDGLKHIKRFVYPGHYSESVKAYHSAKNSGNFDEVIPMQCYGWNFKPVTDSFCKESYQLAGRLDEFRKYPLYFDNRNFVREKELCSVLDGRPVILCSMFGKSSPYPHGFSIINNLKVQFPDHQVVDMLQVKAHRFYDLLGLMDRAKALVTIDTGHLHLARASKVPVIAFVTDRPSRWHGAVPPENTVLAMRYNEVSMSKIITAIEAL